MPRLSKEAKQVYFQRVNKIIGSPEFKFDKKMGGADIEFILNHLISGKSFEECRNQLKRTFKIDDEGATRCMRKIMNMYKEIEARTN